MSAHYKQPLDWNDKLLEDSKSIIDKWYQMFVSIKNKIKIPETMLLPLYDDLNTPRYIGNLHKLFDKANSGNSKDKEIFVSACNFVGLLNETKEQWLEFKKIRSSISENEILSKIELRNNARGSKDYELADKIRKELFDKDVLIEDKNGKTIWKYK